MDQLQGIRSRSREHPRTPGQLRLSTVPHIHRQHRAHLLIMTRTHGDSMRRIKYLVGFTALIVTGCQELEVVNPNEPDRTRATQQPTAAESFVASAFRTWWPVAGHDDYPAWALSTAAREITSGFADFGQLEISAEPRSAWNNSPVNARNDVSEEPWY